MSEPTTPDFPTRWRVLCVNSETGLIELHRQEDRQWVGSVAFGTRPPLWGKPRPSPWQALHSLQEQFTGWRELVPEGESSRAELRAELDALRARLREVEALHQQACKSLQNAWVEKCELFARAQSLHERAQRAEALCNQLMRGGLEACTELRRHLALARGELHRLYNRLALLALPLDRVAVLGAVVTTLDRLEELP